MVLEPLFHDPGGLAAIHDSDPLCDRMIPLPESFPSFVVDPLHPDGDGDNVCDDDPLHSPGPPGAVRCPFPPMEGEEIPDLPGSFRDGAYGLGAVSGPHGWYLELRGEGKDVLYAITPCSSTKNPRKQNGQTPTSPSKASSAPHSGHRPWVSS